MYAMCGAGEKALIRSDEETITSKSASKDAVQNVRILTHGAAVIDITIQSVFIPKIASGSIGWVTTHGNIRWLEIPSVIIKEDGKVEERDRLSKKMYRLDSLNRGMTVTRSIWKEHQPKHETSQVCEP